MKNILLFFATVIILTVITLSFKKMREDEDKAARDIDFDEERTAGIEDFTFQQLDEKGLSWKLYGKKASLFENKGMAYLVEIEGIITGGQSDISFKGESASIDLNTKNFILEQKEDIPVTIIMSGDLTLTSDKFIWDNSSKKLTSDNTVNITSESAIIKGNKLTADPVTGEIQIEKVLANIPK